MLAACTARRLAAVAAAASAGATAPCGWMRRAAVATSSSNAATSTSISPYVQGQVIGTQREYFYYVDHNGFLFLDDSRMKNFTSCLKDKKFLDFFFRRLKPNTTSRNPEFPFVSLCGREVNFVRCDDLPIVYHTLEEGEAAQEGANNNSNSSSSSGSNSSGSNSPGNDAHFVYGGTLKVPFQPDKLCMLESGRLYHPAPAPFNLALVASHLALSLSKSMTFGATTTLRYRGNVYPVAADLSAYMDKEEER